MKSCVASGDTAELLALIDHVCIEVDSPVAFITYKGHLLHADDPRVSEYSNPVPLYSAQQLDSTIEIESLRQQLAASQAREVKLREALDDAKYAYLTGEIRIGSNLRLEQALSTPTDTSALDEYVKGKLEQVQVSEPNYHHEAMGCGLEDRNITDRYEAMQYGWDCAVGRMFEQIPDEPLYRLKEKTE